MHTTPDVSTRCILFIVAGRGVWMVGPKPVVLVVSWCHTGWFQEQLVTGVVARSLAGRLGAVISL